jgi:hypothetical protein
LSSLTYVFPPDVKVEEDGAPNDVHPYFFRDGNSKDGPIELPYYTYDQLHSRMMSSEPPPEPLHWEPAVANAYVPSGSFSGSGFTHLILARSPGYTPATADELIPVIERYFYPI